MGDKRELVDSELHKPRPEGHDELAQTRMV